VIDTTKFWGGGVGNINCCLEGSQPAIPSDRVEFEFSVKYSDLMWCSWRYGGCFGSKFEYLVSHWEGCMGSMQCNVEFGYQLSICSGTKENQGKPKSSWPVAGPSGCSILLPKITYFLMIRHGPQRKRND
jgi:hypothetical protein